MRVPTLFAITGLLALVAATPVTPAVPRALPQVKPRKLVDARQDDMPACAKVSQAIYATPRPDRIPASIAYDCITSVPLNVSSAKRLLDALPTYLQWQSTLDALKNPPAEYVEKQFPAVDLLGGLKQIGADIDAGTFKNEYEFGWTLYTLIASAHDGHLTYVPDSVGTVFLWGRPMPLVSVSQDGTKVPEIFAFEDVLGLKYKNISYTPSPVVEIEGQKATEFLEGYSVYGTLQDRDALYNNMFYELAQASLGVDGTVGGMFAGGGRGRFVFPGDTTTLTFSNGTNYTMENYARLIAANFRNINTGEDLAKNFFYYDVASAGAGAGDSAPPAPAEQANVGIGPAPVPLGYPVPVIGGPYNYINGFYIDAPGYEDVAVLQVPTYVGSLGFQAGFQNVTQTFLPKAIADGKTKLIIDLQANGGGTIMQGYDMFKQLFPDEDPYGANRWRYHEAADLVGQVFSDFASRFPRGSENATIRSIQSTYFDYHEDMTVDAKPFESWQQKVGPVDVNGEKYTTLSRWNLSDAYITYISGGINITGYGPLANVTGAPKFKPENIVLLTDGYCASTCTIFSELMTRQLGVKTIAMGGRANQKPMQAIGGVKGVNNLPFASLQRYVQTALRFAPQNLHDKINGSVLRDYDSNLVFSRSDGSPGCNVRDGIPKNDASGVALQFIYEEADCRLYYTPDMTVDAKAIWKAVADAQWGDNSKCVGGAGLKQGLAAEDSVVTTTENTVRLELTQGGSLHTLGDFEKSLGLETHCRIVADGFMSP